MSTDVSSVVSHFPDAENGFTTTLASTISSGATTVPLNSVAGYTNGKPAVFVVDPSDVTKKQTFTGIIDTSGVQVTSVVWTAGTNQTHTGGATVVDYATATHPAMMNKGILVHADQDGTLKAGAVDNAAVLASDVVTTAKILDVNVTTAKIANAAITPSKLSLGPLSSSVATSEATTSGSATDLATAGPSVTMTIGANGLALLIGATQFSNSATSASGVIHYVVSGATTVAATQFGSNRSPTATQATTVNGVVLVSGLTPGSNVFKMQYSTSTGTATFSSRSLTAIPL